MKIRFLTCIAALASAVVTISAVAETSIDDYMKSREKVIQAVHEQYSSQGNENLSRTTDKALRDARLKLQGLVGPINVDGFPNKGQGVLGSRDDEQYNGLDGVAATSLDAKTRIFVTTVPIVKAWLATHRNDLIHYSSVSKMLGTEDFYNATAILDGDGAVYAYGEIPVAIKGGAMARAIIFALGQDDPAPKLPNRLAVTVQRGDHIFILSENVNIRGVMECNSSSVGHSVSFERCFAKRLPLHNDYSHLIKQAQGLVDRVLHAN